MRMSLPTKSLGRLRAIIITVVASIFVMRTLRSSFVAAFAVQKNNVMAFRSSRLYSNSLRNNQSPVASSSIDINGDAVDVQRNVVDVTVKRSFPKVTPCVARNAWLEYHWSQGGGLPILIQSSNTISDDTKMLQRTIYPVLMKETLTLDTSCDEDASFTKLDYIVSEPGPFYRDVIDNSHSASVTFASDEKSEGCEMIWNVRFDTTKWTEFYKAMTLFLVGTSANTIKEVLAAPRVFKMTSNIHCSMDAKSARNEWFEFVWMNGGGLPLPPAFPFGKTIEDTTAKQNILRIPPLITETIVDTFENERMAGFEYTLNSPGWLTFPFLMHTHKGVVEFRSNDYNSISVDWVVEIRPYKIAAPLVEKLVEITVSTLLRNLRVRLTEPGAAVLIKPPRGNTDLLMGRTDFGSVPKDSWLGGVLDAHLLDNRPTVEQTFAILQPWTWGRTGKGDGFDVVQFKWLDQDKP
ncbi:hypothetical protein ACHAXN_009018 [Cyclotella atomus]